MWAPLLWLPLFVTIAVAQHPTKKRKGEKFSFGSHVADCSPGEELKICRPACEASCSNPEPDCFRVCSTASCVCLPGFVRMNGICIPKVACQMFGRLIPPSTKPAIRKPVPEKKASKAPPKTAKRAKLSRTASLPHTTTTPKPTKPTPPPITIIRPKRPPPQCGRGQQFTLCVCDSTCETEMICKTCSSGCGCFPHFVRGEDGACMPKSQCETKTIRIFEVPEYDDEPEPPPPTTTTTHKPNTPHPPAHDSEEGPIPPTPQRRRGAGPPGIGLQRTGPPAITPFSFFRRKRIARRKAALKKLLAV